jgi:hypothetical protein
MKTDAALIEKSESSYLKFRVIALALGVAIPTAIVLSAIGDDNNKDTSTRNQTHKGSNVIYDAPTIEEIASRLEKTVHHCDDQPKIDKADDFQTAVVLDYRSNVYPSTSSTSSTYAVSHVRAGSHIDVLGPLDASGCNDGSWYKLATVEGISAVLNSTYSPKNIRRRHPNVHLK